MEWRLTTLKEVPEFRAYDHFVPSLMMQIQRYTEQGRQRPGPPRRLARSSRRSSEIDSLYISTMFFKGDAGRQDEPRRHRAV